MEIIFNGKTLTLNGKGLNIFTQIGSPGTIDDKRKELLRACRLITDQTRQESGCKISQFSQKTGY